MCVSQTKNFSHTKVVFSELLYFKIQSYLEKCPHQRNRARIPDEVEPFGLSAKRATPSDSLIFWSTKDANLLKRLINLFDTRS